MINFVILCGGSGTRLWPKSREKLPKQLLKLTNENTMFQNTVLRIYNLVKNINNKDIKNKLIIICNKEHSHIIEKQIDELKLHINFKIISEPKGRDSAPAICISALLGNIHDNTFIMPCDHIFNDNEFANSCIRSFEYIEKSIITFGIKPTRIETGYGYIKVDDNKNTIQFVEKPNYDTAKSYFEEGTYLWNAGIFAFKNKNMIDCFKKYANDIYVNCVQTLENTNLVGTNILLSENPFIDCKSISVDYAIMEKLCNDDDTEIQKKTILYNSSWSDIGSFMALYEELEKDENSNVTKGDVITIDTNNCFIDSEHCLTATIGLKNLIIVNTDDALLICDNNKTQDVKKVVEKLKQSKREESILHKTVFRPWGYYKNVEGKDEHGFKIKRISVYPGKRLSLQSHNHRSEHWVIVKGTAKVQVDDSIRTINKDESIYIPVKALHRIENIGDDLLEFTETQIGDYLGEDDIIRYEDDFGRI
jgi:mannose-1-phosphate guanylyltransferase/mannose-6-phosphate isomerase